eukprot:1340615-Amorphochlora_amoeboformis.AAC.1
MACVRVVCPAVSVLEIDIRLLNTTFSFAWNSIHPNHVYPPRLGFGQTPTTLESSPAKTHNPQALYQTTDPSAFRKHACQRTRPLGLGMERPGCSWLRSFRVYGVGGGSSGEFRETWRLCGDFKFAYPVWDFA